MSTWLTVALSSVGAAAAALLGAITGSIIASRSQTRHWRRDQQISACIAIVTESTRTQLAIRRQWRHREEVDWNGWNEALAMISLVGTPGIVEAARAMDSEFWQSTSRLTGKTTEQDWSDIVVVLEASRLEFINLVRREIVDVSGDLSALPIARPPMPEAA